MRKDKEKISLPIRGTRSDIEKFNSQRAKDGREKRIGFDLNYLFSAILMIVIAVMSFGLVLYFSYHLINAFTADVTYAPAYPITETEYRRASGYIFREEEIISQSSSGMPNYCIADGERIGIGEDICEIHSSISAEAVAQIAEIDRRLSVLHASCGSENIRAGIPEAMKDSAERYDEIMSLIANEDYAAAEKLSDAFLASLIRLKLLENDDGGVRAEIKRLETEREVLLATYGTVTEKISSDRIGYFFRDADGYENIFDPSLLSEITVGKFAELINQQPEDVSGAVGKIAPQAKWYLSVYFDGKDAQGFTEGENYNIVFHDNESRSVSMTLERLVHDLEDYDSDGDRSEAVLIFSSVKMPSEFRYLRVQEISVEAACYKGYRIPITSVRYYDGMTGVYVLAGGYVMFRQIDIIYETSGYCIAALYADAEPGKPLTYTSLGFEGRTAFDGLDSIYMIGDRLGLEKTEYNNGGIPVPKGRTLRYFYHLDDLEQVILTGKNLYHGKALD